MLGAVPYETYRRTQARRRATWLLVLTLVLIFYASFFPFRFDTSRLIEAWRAGPAGLLPWGYSARADRAGNLLSYLPLGALLAYLAPLRWRAAAAFAGALLLAAALSCTVELLQHMTRSRVPNLVDVVMNATGGALGALGGALLRSRPWPLGPIALRHARPEPIALVLLALWFATHAVPFMPRLNQGHAWAGMRPLRDLDHDPVAMLAFGAGFLVVAAAVRRLVVEASFMRVLLSIAAISLALRVVFVGQWLTLDECVGLAVSLPIAAWLRGVTRARAFRITAAVATLAFAVQLAFPPALAWSSAVVFLERAFMIVGALWLIAGGGASLLFATCAFAIGIGLLAGATTGLLVIVAGILVHAGRVLHSSPVPRVVER
ncbi:MAG: VanZ family protein [Steroidobacteraceae bacterium]|nr:VanZ family protein [Steroidobacteraceae bacterium]